VGYPVVRHPMLHYPEDPNVYGLKYQWLVGPEIMVAPVVDEGDNDVNACLPAGETFEANLRAEGIISWE